MPELPEVETIAAELRKRLVGEVIREAVLARADYLRSNTKNFEKRLAGRQISAVGRTGKRILVSLDDGAGLTIHLGMSGRVTLESPDSVVEPHTHCVIRLVNRPDEVRFRDPRRFGGIWYAKAGEQASLGQLGPDALGVDVRQFADMCHRRRQIKALMLDQQVISGLGNIYCDEALFEARIHPLRIASELAPRDAMRLARGIRRILERAIHSGGSTLRDYLGADGRAGDFQKVHRVYGRRGEACLRCGTTIERFVAAGRSTHICPACQTPPAVA